jgi:hypothetical protein
VSGMPGTIDRRTEAPPRWRSRLRAILAAMLATLVLALPTNPVLLTDWKSYRFPLELVPILLLAVSLRGTLLSLFRGVVTALLGLILVLKLADIGTGFAFQRPFNPYLDVKLLSDGWHLLSHTMGVGEAVAIVCVALMVCTLLVAAIYWGWGGFNPYRRFQRGRLVGVALSLIGVGFLGHALGGERLRAFGVQAQTLPYVAHRIAMIRESVADLRAFEAELGGDAVQTGPQLSALAGRDVVLVFVESYGRSAIEDPRYASRIGPRLDAIERQLEQNGLQARSGWLRSPTVGGLSWLAHGTLLSGSWVDSQARYDRLIISRRPTLNRIFRQSGWQTAAVMPAITRPWPEAAYFGYDRIHAAQGLGYAGKPFGWITMPDQFTLGAFERLERSPGHRPVMAEIALISSHAPWTPVPTLMDWDHMGDGRVFDPQATSGDPPSVVWADPDRVRAQYLASVDYTLETLGSYMVRFGDNTLFILLGDHQPAAIVTGEGASRDVPIHFVSRDARLLDRIAAWTSPGMVPATEMPSVRMDGFRDIFLDGFR